MTTLANTYRPKKFADVIGQDTEKEVLVTIMKKGWKPPAILICGPFGTGKTTLARLLARAMLCDTRAGVEPCGECTSCKALDYDNHPGYTEVDAASQGLVGDIRSMKDFVTYQTTGGKPKIICYDEAHMLSAQAQNALLQILEEGAENTMFLFCTTDAQKMLPTIRSRCVITRMKLLPAKLIKERIAQVAKQEGLDLEEKAARVIATYVRGHVRDALVLLEQLARLSDTQCINEEMVRNYLRLDRYDDIYKLLTEMDRSAGTELLETLLCDYAVSELTEIAATILVNAHKVKLGMTNFTQTDTAWLKKVNEVHGETALEKAEGLLSIPAAFASIVYGEAVIGKLLWKPVQEAPKEDAGWTGPTAVQLRKVRS